jgi:hypothetical protein
LGISPNLQYKPMRLELVITFQTFPEYVLPTTGVNDGVDKDEEELGSEGETNEEDLAENEELEVC